MLDLAKLKRTELQKLSKDEGLKANLKTEALVEALEAHFRANPSRKPSAQAGPSKAPSSQAMSRAPSRTESTRAPSRAESTAGRAPSRTTSQAQTGTQRKVTTSQPFRPTNSTTGASNEDAKSAATAAPAQAENSTIMTPRTLRKAKDTQLRLGVGRPKLIGGTGARATNPKPVRTATGARSVTGASTSAAGARRKTPASGTTQAKGKAKAQADDDKVAAPVPVDDSTGPPVQLPSISEDGQEGASSSSGSRVELQLEGDADEALIQTQTETDMPAIPIVPIDVTNTPSRASPNATSTNTKLSPGTNARITGLEKTTETLRTRVDALEAQNAGLLVRLAALEAIAHNDRAPSYALPGSPALSIPQSARIRSDASSLVPQSARIRSDASSLASMSMSMSRPQSAAGSRRVSGMPSPSPARQSSLVVQGWTAEDMVITEEEEPVSSTPRAPQQTPTGSDQRIVALPPLALSPTPTQPAVTRPAPPPAVSPSPTPARAMAGPMAMPTLPVPKQQSMANLGQRRPLWEGKLYSEPYPPPGPSALGKHARDSLGTAPNSPAVQEEQGTSTERPMRKKPRLGHGHPPVRRAAEEPQLEPRTTPGGFPLLSSTMAEFADRRAQGLSGPPPHSFRFHEYYPSIGSNDGPSPFATYQPSSGTSGSSVFEDQQQQKQQQPSTSSGLTGDERVPSINKSFGSSSASASASAPKTPPRNPDNAPPPPETPLTAAYGPVIAALFRPPNPEDLPEEERSPEKKTLYGTERANDTRFGEFGWGWRY
ncbi:hypothetical protein EXIGLDRAFT_833113 [Exidia glandulosa HHB12029]|uniref:Uncharacterized protein n=1 Tax=Exidia glandulosa HHB12029 TaxID=1314781 RepID=A0A165KZJ6_EXIGL|nr:hypothetical protein EXIGLDRAFT_833113 [Exidia glandulosa HHB12029]